MMKVAQKIGGEIRIPNLKAAVALSKVIERPECEMLYASQAIHSS